MLIPRQVCDLVHAVSKGDCGPRRKFESGAIYLYRDSDEDCRAVITNGQLLVECRWGESALFPDLPSSLIPHSLAMRGFRTRIPRQDMLDFSKGIDWPRSRKVALLVDEVRTDSQTVFLMGQGFLQALDTEILLSSGEDKHNPCKLADLDYLDLVPEPVENLSAGHTILGLPLLSKLAKTLGKCSGSNIDGCDVQWPTDPEKPIRFETAEQLDNGSTIETVAVLMPRRHLNDRKPHSLAKRLEEVRKSIFAAARDLARHEVASPQDIADARENLQEALRMFQGLKS